MLEYILILDTSNWIIGIQNCSKNTVLIKKEVLSCNPIKVLASNLYSPDHSELPLISFPPTFAVMDDCVRQLLARKLLTWQSYGRIIDCCIRNFGFKIILTSWKGKQLFQRSPYKNCFYQKPWQCYNNTSRENIQLQQYISIFASAWPVTLCILFFSFTQLPTGKMQVSKSQSPRTPSE